MTAPQPPTHDRRGPASGTGPSWAGRRAFTTLPGRRRRTLLHGRDVPRDQQEADAALGYARWVDSPAGAAESVVVGVAGAAAGAVVVTLLGGDLSDPNLAMFGPAWVLGWSVTQIPMRRRTAERLEHGVAAWREGRTDPR